MMLRAPPGAVVKLAPYDWGVSRHQQEPPPSEGDLLVTEGAKGYGTAYLILNARLMARSAVPGRYALTCRVLGPAAQVITGELNQQVGSGDVRALVIRWYSRNRRRSR